MLNNSMLAFPGPPSIHPFFLGGRDKIRVLYIACNVDSSKMLFNLTDYSTDSLC